MLIYKPFIRLSVCIWLKAVEINSIATKHLWIKIFGIKDLSSYEQQILVPFSVINLFSKIAFNILWLEGIINSWVNGLLSWWLKKMYLNNYPCFLNTYYKDLISTSIIFNDLGFPEILKSIKVTVYSMFCLGYFLMCMNWVLLNTLN